VVNGQWAKRCLQVSGSLKHRGQEPQLGQPLRSKLTVYVTVTTQARILEGTNNLSLHSCQYKSTPFAHLCMSCYLEIDEIYLLTFGRF
jgi:hypothetical protein